MEQGPAPERPDAENHKVRNIAIAMVVGVLVVVGAAAGGYAAGSSAADDADEVAALKDDLKDARDAGNEATGQAAELASRLADVQNENTELQDRLDAERNLKGESDADADDGDSGGTAPVGDLKVGEAGSVGEFTVKPTSVSAAGGSGDRRRFRASLTVKNNGSESESPFCGGGATLIDDEGRSFDGEAVINEVSAACEDLQPGLTATILIDFTTAKGAKPAVLSLAPDAFDDETVKTWAIP